MSGNKRRKLEMQPSTSAGSQSRDCGPRGNRGEREGRRVGKRDATVQAGTRSHRSRSPAYLHLVPFQRLDRLQVLTLWVDEKFTRTIPVDYATIGVNETRGYKIEEFAVRWQNVINWTSPVGWMNQLEQKEVWFTKGVSDDEWGNICDVMHRNLGNVRHAPGEDYIEHLHESTMEICTAVQRIHVGYYRPIENPTVPLILAFFNKAICDVTHMEPSTPIEAETWRTTEDSGSLSEDSTISAASIGLTSVDQVRRHRRRLRRSGHYVRNREKMIFQNVQVHARLSRGFLSDSSSSGSNDEREVCQKALYRSPELETHVEHHGTRIVRVMGDEVGGVEICIMSVDEPNPLVLQNGNISYIDYVMVGNVDKDILGLGVNLEKCKAARLLTNELAREKICGRGEIVYTKHPLVAVKIAARTTVIFDDYGIYQAIRSHRKEVLYVNTKGSWFLRVLTIEQMINNVTGMRLGLILCRDDEKFTFRLTSYYGMITRLRNFANLVLTWRKKCPQPVV